MFNIFNLFNNNLNLPKDYTLVKPLGKGGFGKTYLVKDQNNNQLVVKLLHSDNQRNNNSNFQKIYQEAFTLKQCESHDHIVKIVDVIGVDNQPAIVMEYIDGLELFKIVEAGELSYADAIKYIRQIGSALEFIHSKKLVHRDVQPRNILIKSTGEAILIDFGNSRNVDRNNTANFVDGYAPVEQYDSNEAEGNYTDVYSLSATLYYLLTKRHPPNALLREKAIVKNEEDCLISPSQINDEISKSLNDAILKGLEIYPKNRPQTVSQWLDLLPKNLVNNDPINNNLKKSEKNIDNDLSFSQKPTNNVLKPDVIFPEQISSVDNKTKKTVDVNRKSNRKKTKNVIIESEKPSINILNQHSDNKHFANSFDAVNISDLQEFEFETVKVNYQGEITHKHRKHAKYFTQDLGNNVNLDLIYIPNGTFSIGTENEEIEKLCRQFNSEEFRRESPCHEVKISSFFMSKYPITQLQWKTIALKDDLKVKIDLNSTPSHFKNNDNLPVENIKWYEAQEFCDRLSKLNSHKYRLPYEAEWEYVCRGSDNQQLNNNERSKPPFSFGETISTDLVNYQGITVYKDEKQGHFRNKTIPVNTFKPNDFGLYDLHGNVWEWCQDNWQNDYASINDQNIGNANLSPLRGGSYSSEAIYCRCSFRDMLKKDSRKKNVGFRVVLAE